MKSLIALVGLSACAAFVLAEPPKNGAEAASASKQECCTASGGRASSEVAAKFEKMKKLAGVWQSEGAAKDGNPEATVIYRVVSAGSAVAEYTMPGTDHEMVTMYHLDGDSILATHYCALGNQPRMRSKAGGSSDVLAFDFIDGTNMASPNDMHIHSLTMTFADDDHVTAAWRAYQDGKPSEHSPDFKLARVKDTDAAAKIITASLTSGCGGASGACCESGKAEAKK